ncbi:MAG: choice-of-anchor J domain-containing protein [Xanthomonadales bacterium]|nr:choice-of-anchor J domain-containing protein [Xanthomonadales bacterium]
MNRTTLVMIALLALAGTCTTAHAQSADDAIFCSGFESGGHGACASATLNEGFDDITTLAADGWIMLNHSDPLGFSNWYQGDSETFVAQTGEINAYIAANFDNTAEDGGTLSNWLITPELAFSAQTTLSFYTRTDVSPTDFPDRLEVRLCLGASCTSVGTSADDVGNFTTLIMTVNPTLSASGYPATWTQYTVGGAEGIPSSGQGRIAFRYYVTESGPSKGDYIGIDSVSVH